MLAKFAIFAFLSISFTYVNLWQPAASDPIPSPPKKGCEKCPDLDVVLVLHDDPVTVKVTNTKTNGCFVKEVECTATNEKGMGIWFNDTETRSSSTGKEIISTRNRSLSVNVTCDENSQWIYRLSDQKILTEITSVLCIN